MRGEGKGGVEVVVDVVQVGEKEHCVHRNLYPKNRETGDRFGRNFTSYFFFSSSDPGQDLWVKRSQGEIIRAEQRREP